METAFALDLPEEHHFVPTVRHMARLFLKSHRLASDDVADVETVLSELASNATRHARSADGLFHVRLELHRDRVILIVRDSGQGFQTASVLPVGAARTDPDGTERVGGFGLDLVGRLTDSVEFQTNHPTGTTVRAEKRLRAPQPNRKMPPP